MQSAFVARAKHARERIAAVPPDAKGDYLNAVRGLPAEIRLVGLGQALATLRADERTGCRRLYGDIEDWVFGRGIYPTRPVREPHLLHAIIGAEAPPQPEAATQQRYRTAVAEIDAYLAILKRLSEVFLK